MKSVTRGQALEVSARVGTQVNWDEVDGDILQTGVINLSPEEFGRRFTLFLKNSARTHTSGGLKITPRPFDPVKFIGEKWSLIPEEHDVRCDTLTEVDFSKVEFETCLKDGESSIKGEEKLVRLKANGNTRLGATVFMGLWEDYQTNKENSVLDRLYKEQGLTYLDFFGDVLLYPHGNRYVLYLYRGDGGQWRWHCYWLGSDWSAHRRSASLAS